MIIPYYLPRFFNTRYEIKLEEKLNESLKTSINEEYEALLTLRKKARDASSSLHQLKGIATRPIAGQIKALEIAFDIYIFSLLNPSQINKEDENTIKNTFSDIKAAIEAESTWLSVSTGCNLTADAIIGASFIAGIALASWVAVSAVLGTALIMSGPLGAGLVAAATIVVCLGFLAWTIYSASVDIRFILGKQETAVEAFIEELFPDGTMEMDPLLEAPETSVDFDSLDAPLDNQPLIPNPSPL